MILFLVLLCGALAVGRGRLVAGCRNSSKKKQVTDGFVKYAQISGVQVENFCACTDIKTSFPL